MYSSESKETLRLMLIDDQYPSPQNDMSPTGSNGNSSNSDSNRFFTPQNDKGNYFPNFDELTIQIEDHLDFSSQIQSNKSQFDEYQKLYENASVLLNKGIKETMEDRYQIVSSLPSRPDIDLYVVLDGHGTDKISEFLSKSFASFIDEAFKIHSCPIEALQLGFENIDVYISNDESLSPRTSGCVVTCILICNQKQIYIANLGDSRAMMISQNSHQSLTSDHTPYRVDEYERINEAGGYCIPIRNSLRLMGSLNVTRSFGDLVYRPHLIAQPEIYTYDINSDDQILLLATDGLWNEQNQEEIYKIAEENSTEPHHLPIILHESILKRKGQTSDNISIIAINLDKYKKHDSGSSTSDAGQMETENTQTFTQ